MEKIISRKLNPRSQTQSGQRETESSDDGGLGLLEELKALRNGIPENLSYLLDLLRFLEKSFAGNFSQIFKLLCVLFSQFHLQLRQANAVSQN